MRIAIIGAGYVGLASAAGLCLHGHSVVMVERDHERRRKLWDNALDFSEPGLGEALTSAGESLKVVARISDVRPSPQMVFVAVGTPSLPDGSVDLSQIFEAVLAIAAQCDGALVVIRSTVAPGTTQRLITRHRGLRFAHVPEFLREGHALSDFLSPTRIVLGVHDTASTNQLQELFRGFNRPILTMSPDSAELTKVASNVLLASRVALINELSRVAHEVGADIDRVRTAIGLDPRIGAHYLEPSIGFGGSCLPKDVSGLSCWGESRGLDLPVMRAITASNTAQLAWVLTRIPSIAKVVAVWGIAFKPGTADVRNSSALALINQLCARGQRVDAYDPLVPDTQVLPEGARRAVSPVESLIDADFLVVVHASPEYLDNNALLGPLARQNRVLRLSRTPQR